MNRAKKAYILAVFNRDVEYHYQSFLRITEICKFGTVCQTLHERVHASLRSHSHDAVHCNGIDPAPFTWLAGIAKLGMSLRSLRLVRRFLCVEDPLYWMPSCISVVRWGAVHTRNQWVCYSFESCRFLMPNSFCFCRESEIPQVSFRVFFSSKIANLNF